MSLRSCLILIILICLMALGMAWGAEIWGHLKPCALCLWQRYLYMITAGIAAIFLLSRALKGLLISAFLFLANAGVAFYQVMIEQEWIEAPAFCQKMGPTPMTLEALRLQLMSQPDMLVPCNVISWQLFGLSMAAYNVIFCATLSGFCIYYFNRFRKRNHGRTKIFTR